MTCQNEKNWEAHLEGQPNDETDLKAQIKPLTQRRNNYEKSNRKKKIFNGGKKSLVMKGVL